MENKTCPSLVGKTIKHCLFFPASRGEGDKENEEKDIAKRPEKNVRIINN